MKRLILPVSGCKACFRSSAKGSVDSNYLEKHGEGIDKVFKESLSLPKAQEREKGQDKGKGKGMERE